MHLHTLGFTIPTHQTLFHLSNLESNLKTHLFKKAYNLHKPCCHYTTIWTASSLIFVFFSLPLQIAVSSLPLYQSVIHLVHAYYTCFCPLLCTYPFLYVQRHGINGTLNPKIQHILALTNQAFHFWFFSPLYSRRQNFFLFFNQCFLQGKSYYSMAPFWVVLFFWLGMVKCKPPQQFSTFYVFFSGVYYAVKITNTFRLFLQSIILYMIYRKKDTFLCHHNQKPSFCFIFHWHS